MSILPDMSLLKNLTNTTSMETYRAVATSVLAQHSPERYEYVPRDDWPDYLPRRDKLPREPNYSGPVLDTSAGPRDNVGAIIKPADYGLPMLNPPFCYIDNRDALTDAGQAVYDVFSTINFIIASPAVELGNRQEIAEKIKELHRTHGYPLDVIKDQLLPLAQQRDDIPTYR